jgi:hypothetical protein
MSGICQFVVVPIQKEFPASKNYVARTQDITPVTLPFWDDFSTSGMDMQTLRFGNTGNPCGLMRVWESIPLRSMLLRSMGSIR